MQWQYNLLQKLINVRAQDHQYSFMFALHLARTLIWNCPNIEIMHKVILSIMVRQNLCFVKQGEFMTYRTTYPNFGAHYMYMSMDCCSHLGYTKYRFQDYVYHITIETGRWSRISRHRRRLCLRRSIQDKRHVPQIGRSMGSIWVLSAPGGPHVGPINLAIRGVALVPIQATTQRR